jgi:hypothetical protein
MIKLLQIKYREPVCTHLSITRVVHSCPAEVFSYVFKQPAASITIRGLLPVLLAAYAWDVV